MEIKIRAWDKVNKKMYYPPYDYPEPQSGMLMPMDIDGLYLSFDGDSVVLLDDCGNYEYVSDLDLMLWTSMTDKNNKEIYDQDIVICTSYLDEDIPSFKAVVEWDKAGFVLRKISDFTFSPSFNTTLNNNFSFEVIGNTYQNPDLLGAVIK